MKKISFILFVLLWAIILMPASCVREVVMDADEKPMVVVECVISNNPVQTLHLRYTKGAAKKDYEVVTEAEAVLIDLTDGSEAGRFVKVEDGVWTLDYEAIDKHEYRLEVSVPGYDLITAEQRMPSRPDVRARRNDPYMYLAVVHEHTEWDQSCVYNLSSIGVGSIWIYAMNYNRQTNCREIAEYICTNIEADDFNLTDERYSPQIDTIMHSRWNGAPPIPAITGIYHKLRGRLMHREYLRVPGGTEAFGALMISGTFEGFHPVEFDPGLWDEYPFDYGVIAEPDDDQGYLVFAKISEEYERYHLESFRFQELEKSSKLSDIYLRDNVFSNINGGLGIFGAKAETKTIWSEKPTLSYLRQ